MLTIRRVSIGVTVAVLGLAAVPALSFSASKRRHQSCANGKALRHQKCVRLTAPEVLSATIIVHVYASYGTECTVEQAANHECGPSLEEGARLRVSRLGPSGEVVRSMKTKSHTVQVAPGRYEVELAVGTDDQPQRATVTAGRTVEVELLVIRH